jgi:predicted DNA-binding transcriptional regulator YafY
MPPTPKARPPALEETKRIGRVLRIIQLISAQPRIWTRRSLAVEFELSERMVDNDLQLIRHALRFELRRSHREGYYFVGGPLLKPITLSIPEVLALALAAQQARATGTVDSGAIAGALANLEDALPPGIVPYLRRTAAETSEPAFPPVRALGGTLATVQRGLLELRKVAIAYASASQGDAVSERIIAPYCLLPYERSWQIIADDSARQEVRMFKVNRIQRCELTEERYAIPDDFDVSSYLGSTWGVLRGESGPEEDVVLRFSVEAAPWVRDERWHPSQETETLADGTLVMRFRCSITHELVRWVLSFGGEVAIEQPDALLAAVRAEASRMLQKADRGDTRG